MASSHLSIRLYGDLAEAVTAEAGHQQAATGKTVSAAQVVAAALKQLWGDDLSQIPHKQIGSSAPVSERGTAAVSGSLSGSTPQLPDLDDLFSARI